MQIRCMHCMKEYEDSEECCPACGFVKGTPPKEIYHLFPEVMLAKRYQIGTVVSYGGFGILYRAWDTKLNVMVAVKEYFPSGYVNRNPGEKEIFVYTSKKREEFREGLEGFLQEARSTAKFSTHPNIVHVYDYFEENGTAYMVMEYMEGKTLKQHTKEQGGRIGYEEAVRLVSGICEDLQVVHEAGILHRDISPDNIMLCSDGTIKLFDFGAARFSDLEKETTRTIILKIGFAPPEQYRAKSKQGPYTDVYALGATLYRTITGQLPDESVNRQEAILKEGKDTLIPPKQLVPELPEYLDTAICRAMAIQPELRFQNVMEFRSALLKEKSFATVEAELKKRKQRRKLGIGALGVALALGIFGCFHYYQERQRESTLNGANVTLWVPLSDTETLEEKSELMEELLSEFRADYPTVGVSLSYIKEEEYPERIREAEQSGEFPTLYRSIEECGADRRENLNEVLSLLSLDEYYYLDQLDGEVYALPLGFYAPVKYVNTLVTEEGDLSDSESFLAGKQETLLADTELYDQVQETLSGIYSVEAAEENAGELRPTLFWSVDGKADALDRKAAERMLYYFLSESAQDILHIQNSYALPLNRKECAAYFEINPELSFLETALEAEVTKEGVE